MAVNDVIVLRALGLGDLLTAVPALRAVARAFPAIRRTLLAPPSLAPLAYLTGAVDAVVPASGLGSPPPGAPRGAVAVNLHGRGPQSHRLLLATRPARLLAFAHADVPESADGPPWRPDEREVARWCRLLGAFGIAADPDDLDLALPSIAVAPAARGATLLHPGAASGARRWPVARWAAVARAECAVGRRVVVTGSRDERALAAAVAAAAGLRDDVVLAGTLDLVGLAGVVAAAGRVVCGDTGVAHLATALRTPSVLLFGPCRPCEWGPPADRPWHRVLWAGTTGDPHAAAADPGLLRIGVVDVLHALAGLPASERAGGARRCA